MKKRPLIIISILGVLIIGVIGYLGYHKYQLKKHPDTQKILESTKLGAEEIFRFPAEWERHEAIWLGTDTHENKEGVSTAPVALEMIRHLVPHVKVKIAVNLPREINTIRELLSSNNIPSNYVSFYWVPHASIWFRDMGPIFLMSNRGKLKIARFNFNAWGYAEMSRESMLSALVDREVSKEVAAEMGLDTVITENVSEGGNREFNGKGTMITVEAVELQRNPDKTIEELENDFKRVLGVEKIIWMKQGLYEDDLAFKGPLPGPDGERNAYRIGTGGHADEFVRFVGPNKILLAEATTEEAQQDPIAAENRRRLEENYEILQSATDQDDNPFEIIRMCLSEPTYVTLGPGDTLYDFFSQLSYEDGSTFPAGQQIYLIATSSYFNFLITNGVVLVPKYWRPGLSSIIREKDEQVAERIQSLFPDREIIQINPLAINIGSGGMHCISQQEPAFNPQPRPF